MKRIICSAVCLVVATLFWINYALASIASNLGEKLPFYHSAQSCTILSNIEIPEHCKHSDDTYYQIMGTSSLPVA